MKRTIANVLTEIAAIAGMAMLSACAIGPEYVRPDATMATMAANWKTEPGWQVSAPRDGDIKGEWWEIFDDVELNTLEAQALSFGQNLRVAQARVEQARAQANVANAGFFPRLGVQAGETRNRTSADRPKASYNTPVTSVTQNDFNASFVLSYELDFFGKIRAQSNAATSNAGQVNADFENARLIVTAELAADYFALRELDAEIDLIGKTFAAQQRGLDFLSARYELGASSVLDLKQQKSRIAATQTQLIQLQDQRAKYSNAIATLIGTPPPSFTVKQSAKMPAVPDVPLFAPSQLLERRPDIGSAERAMAAANAQIGVAKSAFFPSVALNAQYGSDANQWTQLFTAPSILWAVGLSVSQTLFDAGRTRANVAFNEAGYQLTVANYRQAVLVAMQEVQDGLNSTANLQQIMISANTAAANSAEFFNLTDDRYKAGIATRLELVLAEETMLNNQRIVVQQTGQQLLNSVRLIKALGGGWHNPAL